MRFQTGNTHAMGHGRPPDLARQLLNAEQAAGRIAKLVDRPGSISTCAAQLAERWRSDDRDFGAVVDIAGLENIADHRLEAEIRRRLFAKSRALLQLLAPQAAGLLDDIAEETALEVAAADRAGGRRRRRPARDQVAIMEGATGQQVTDEMRAVVRANVAGTRIHAAPEIATTAAALDRLVDHLEGLAQ